MQRLKDLAISDSGFVFDPYSGATYTVNPTALCILDGLKRGLSRARIVEQLHSAFFTHGDDLARDVDELIQSLRMYGVLAADCEVA
jgi:hypothetical protein